MHGDGVASASDGMAVARGSGRHGEAALGSTDIRGLRGNGLPVENGRCRPRKAAARWWWRQLPERRGLTDVAGLTTAFDGVGVDRVNFEWQTVVCDVVASAGTAAALGARRERRTHQPGQTRTAAVQLDGGGSGEVDGRQRARQG
jgi:hypothetical protein